MKTIRAILRILAFVLSLASVVLFFFPFVNINITGAEGSPFSPSGINLAFGSAINGTDLQISSYYLVVLILGVLTAVCSAFGIKKTASGVWALILGAVNGALFTYVNAQGGQAFVDIRDLSSLGKFAGTSKTLFSWLAVGCVLAGVVITVIALLVNDAIKVRETGKKSIYAKCITFCKDYKSEIKKITWPSWATLVKNTVVVIVISLIVGAFIWLLDWGLGALLNWVLSL